MERSQFGIRKYAMWMCLVFVLITIFFTKNVKADLFVKNNFKETIVYTGRDEGESFIALELCGSNKKIKCVSSNETVATITSTSQKFPSFVVKPKKAGTTKITVIVT